jgi:hypothetical protein
VNIHLTSDALARAVLPQIAQPVVAVRARSRVRNASEGAVDTGMASTRLLEQRQQIREARSLDGASWSSLVIYPVFFF